MHSFLPIITTTISSISVLFSIRANHRSDRFAHGRIMSKTSAFFRHLKGGFSCFAPSKGKMSSSSYISRLPAASGIFTATGDPSDSGSVLFPDLDFLPEDVTHHDWDNSHVTKLDTIVTVGIPIFCRWTGRKQKKVAFKEWTSHWASGDDDEDNPFVLLPTLTMRGCDNLDDLLTECSKSFRSRIRKSISLLAELLLGDKLD